MLPSSTHICFNSYFNSIILFFFFWLKENLEVFRCLFLSFCFLICPLNMKWWIIKEEVDLHTKPPSKNHSLNSLNLYGYTFTNHTNLLFPLLNPLKLWVFCLLTLVVHHHTCTLELFESQLGLIPRHWFNDRREPRHFL